jgi:uncharacterized protein (DUF58 family)
MPTVRGIGLLALAAAIYGGGRVVGTYELYVVSLSLATLVVMAALVVFISGRRLLVERTVYPASPTAGEEASLVLEVANRSLLPTAAVEVDDPLGLVSGSELKVEMSPLGPRARRTLRERVPDPRRGVYRLDPPRISMTDPLGLFLGRRRAGSELDLVVLPQVAALTSCVFFGVRGLGRTAQTRRSLTHASLDLRGVRPHQPGEPLSHIDWKSTARTGTLMLRETEEPAGSDVVILLDAHVASVTGEAPDTSFEAAVSAAGSIADYVLREGFGASVLLQGEGGRLFAGRFDHRERGRQELLSFLAGAEATSRAPVWEAVRQNEALLSQGLALVLITPSFERPLLLLLGELRERGLPVYLVSVDGPSFEGSATPPTVEVERRAFLLALQAAGVPSVTLRYGDRLEEVLSFGGPRRSVFSSGAHQQSPVGGAA